MLCYVSYGLTILMPTLFFTPTKYLLKIDSQVQLQKYV
jgi:hypothetical protein